MRRARVLIAAAGCASLAASAGPPLITDDPDTLPKGGFELNTAYTLDLSARGDAAAGGGRAWEHETPNFDLNYGLADGLQLKLEIPLVVLDEPERSPAHAGLGDLSLGCKVRFLREEDEPLALSIYPALGVPTGDPGRGLGAGKASLTLPVQVGKRFLEDALFVYADGGYEAQFAKGEPDAWFVGLAAEYEAVEGFVLCAEVRREFDAHGGQDDTLFNVGFKWSLAEYAALIAAVGRSFDPTAGSGSSLLVYFGVQWSF